MGGDFGATWRWQAGTPISGLMAESTPTTLLLLGFALISVGFGTVVGASQRLPSQVLAHSLDGDSRLCQLCFFADVQAGGSARFLVLHGNPAAELPAYPSPLRATGEGLGLTVSNDHFSAELSANHGGLRTLRVHGDGGIPIVLTAVGNGHGEEPGFDWGNGGDFLDRAPEGTPGWQKFRTTNWERPPNSW